MNFVQIFNNCVKLLEAMATYFGVTYKEINVVIFCIAWPLLTLLLIISNIVLLSRVTTKKPMSWATKAIIGFILLILLNGLISYSNAVGVIQ